MYRKAKNRCAQMGIKRAGIELSRIIKNIKIHHNSLANSAVGSIFSNLAAK
jgi:hypothetical protein